MKLIVITTALLLGAVSSQAEGQKLSALSATQTTGQTSSQPATFFDLTSATRNPLQVTRHPTSPGGSANLGTCPCAGSPPEGEANCGLPIDTVNGGCNSSPFVYSAIAVPGSVCGTGAYDGTTRDTDWYQFTLTAPATVTWTVTAEFPVVTGLLDNLCPPTILDFDFGAACTATSSIATLGAGTYIAFTAPDFGGAPFVCGGGSDSYGGALTSTAPVTCPCAGSPPEGEANCGLPTDTVNGGCNYFPLVYSPIAVGGSVCGTGAWDGSTRDTDWYQFTLTVPSTVIWTVTAEFPCVTALLDNLCPPTILDFDFGSACGATTSTAVLGPGTYVAFTAPDFNGPILPCGGSNTYEGRLGKPDPMTGLCYPNVAGVRSCPCGNQQVPALSGKGCNNFGPVPAGGTGGATLTASGTPAPAATCDVQFHVMHEHGTANITVLFIGRSIASGVANGAGVRCVASLQVPRPYKKNSIVSGTESQVDFGLGVGTDIDAWTRSGMPTGGVTKYYYAAYRNSKAGDGTHPPCTSTNAFNLSNSGSMVWP